LSTYFEKAVVATLAPYASAVCHCEAIFAEAISTYMGETPKLGDCFVAQDAPRNDIYKFDN
jgi:hypothetical protein